MILLLRLIVAHLVADFLLFPSKWEEKKALKKQYSIFFYVHGFIYGLTTYVLLAEWDNWSIPLCLTIAHLLIDMWRMNNKESTVIFLLYHLIHSLVIFIAWALLVGDIGTIGNIVAGYFNNTNVWVMLMGYLVVIWPMRYAIALATQRWRKEIQNEGLMDAGKWIGQIERILILTFVFINKFEAIGFLITAKSIFRFSEINKERKEAEYILIGTLLSFALSIVWGLLLQMLLQ